MTYAQLTPADLGTLAATLDDCRADGLGDDCTCDRLAMALTGECGISDPAAAWALAHKFWVIVGSSGRFLMLKG